MDYEIERYKNHERFNRQYQKIHRFLLEAEKLEYNEHFHWGRFEWMHRHSFLDKEKLPCITMFQDEKEKIVGLITYDTSYDDRAYLIHTSEDRVLLNQMIDAVLAEEETRAVIKANAKDAALCKTLRERRFERKAEDHTVLALDLSADLTCIVPDVYTLSEPDFTVDDWQYQLVIHRGFDHDDVPEKWSDEVLRPAPNENPALKVFALEADDYCAHCGLWYSEGDTAYVEPVVTVPRHRGQGLAKAVVYEACRRAKAMGAKRAIVISDQPFYYKIGFTLSSAVHRWEKDI